MSEPEFDFPAVFSDAFIEDLILIGINSIPEMRKIVETQNDEEDIHRSYHESNIPHTLPIMDEVRKGGGSVTKQIVDTYNRLSQAVKSSPSLQRKALICSLIGRLARTVQELGNIEKYGVNGVHLRMFEQDLRRFGAQLGAERAQDTKAYAFREDSIKLWIENTWIDIMSSVRETYLTSNGYRSKPKPLNSYYQEMLVYALDLIATALTSK